MRLSHDGRRTTASSTASKGREDEARSHLYLPVSTATPEHSMGLVICKNVLLKQHLYYAQDAAWEIAGVL